jgi:hypothetical protein
MWMSGYRGSGCEIRPAHAADLVAFYGTLPPQSVRAFVAAREGTTLGVAGIAYPRGLGAEPYLFSDWNSELRRHPRTIIAGARAMLAAFARPGLRAIADPGEALAPKLLRRLGFVADGDPADGIFIYRGNIR